MEAKIERVERSANDLRNPLVKNKEMTNWFEVKVHKTSIAAKALDKVSKAMTALDSMKDKMFNPEGNNKSSEDSVTGSESILKDLSDLGENVMELPEIMIDAVISKDVLTINLDATDTFIFPYPVSFKETYSQNFKESELSQDSKKLDMIEQGIPALAGAIPMVGSSLGASFSGVLSALRDGVESYAKRAGAFLDNNLMFIFIGANPRNFEVSFNFPFMSEEHRSVVFKALKKLKSYSLPTGGKLLEGSNILPLRYLRVEHAFSFNFKYDDSNSELGLNDVLRGKVESQQNVQTEGFFLSNITTTPLQMSEAGGFYYDGSPKGIRVTLSFIEAKTITNSVWEGVEKNLDKDKTFSLKKHYSPASEKTSFLKIKVYEPSSNVITKAAKEAASEFNKLLGKVKTTDDGKSETTDEMLNRLEQENHKLPETHVASATLNPFSDHSIKDETAKAVGQAFIGMADKVYSVNQSLAGMEAFSDAVLGTSIELTKLAAKSVAEAFADDTGFKAGSDIVNNGKVLANLILPIPASIPNDEISNSYNVNSVDNLDRAEKMLSSLSNMGGADKDSNSIKEKSKQFAASKSMGRSIMKSLGQGIVAVAKTAKEYAIAEMERGGLVLNPYTISSFQGTEIRKYNISYNIIFKSVEHFRDVCKMIRLLKYHMSPSYFNDSMLFLQRPNMFGLSFNNNVLDDYYGLQDKEGNTIPLNLTSITTSYDDSYSEEHGFPRSLNLNLQFAELAPRRRGHAGYDS